MEIIWAASIIALSVFALVYTIANRKYLFISDMLIICAVYVPILTVSILMISIFK